MNNMNTNNKTTFTIKDMENAFKAGSNKTNWTKIKLHGVVSGCDYDLEPIFEKWFENYKLLTNKNINMRNNLREIQAYSSNTPYELNYKEKYWFHQWLDNTTALIETESGELKKAQYNEFRFKVEKDNESDED